VDWTFDQREGFADADTSLGFISPYGISIIKVYFPPVAVLFLMTHEEHLLSVK